MIDHTGLTVSSYAKSMAFYKATLAAIGYELISEIPTEYTGGVHVAGFGEPGRPDFWMSEGTPNKPHVHVAFRVDSQKKVDAFYAAAIKAGGKDNGGPGPRPHYSASYYGAFVWDLDGHNIEAVFHG